MSTELVTCNIHFVSSETSEDEKLMQAPVEEENETVSNCGGANVEEDEKICSVAATEKDILRAAALLQRLMRG